MIQVMATTVTPSADYPLILELWHVNIAACVALRDMGTFSVEIGETSFKSPICQIILPQQVLYVSGVSDELLARAR